MKKSALILLIAAVAAFCGCAKKEVAQKLIPPTPALLSQAKCENVHAYISTLGTTAAFDDVNIVPQVSGQIVKINFKQGDTVKRGDVLAVIDTRPYEAEVRRAEGNLRQAEAQLKIDRLEVERNRKLAKDNYVDKQTFDSYLAKVDVDMGVVETNRAVLENAKINLDWCYIKAPVDGMTGLYNINLGNVVSAGTSVITTVRNVQKLYCDFVIPSQRLYDALSLMKSRGGKLRVAVSFVEDNMSADHTRIAEVAVVSNKIRYETGTAVLRGVLDNSDHLFWPQQPVRVVLDLAEMKNAVLIPDGAINTSTEGEYIYVAKPIKGGVFEVVQTPVTTGQLYKNNMRYVKGNVKGGDLIVIDVSQLRLQVGPFVYSADARGLILGEDGKPVTSIVEMQKFLKKSAEIVAPLRAEYFGKMKAAKIAAQQGEIDMKKASASLNAPQQNSGAAGKPEKK